MASSQASRSSGWTKSSSTELTQYSDESYSPTKQDCSVILPDLFSSIMAIKPVINPHYHEVKPKADAWIAKIVQANEKWAQRTSRADFCYLAAAWAPDCDEEALRIMVDWNHWVVVFDDQFDEGHLSHNLAAAQAEIDRAIAVIDDVNPDKFIAMSEDPVRYALQSIWSRIKERSSKQTQDHWREMHLHYFTGLLDQVKTQSEGRVFTRDVQEYMRMRRDTIGAYPAIALTEFAVGIDLPKKVLSHPSLQECMAVSVDLVLLVNDILSYTKDLKLGVDHNLISLLTQQGLSTQQALNRIGSMLDECYRRWYIALAGLPPYGENIDRPILRFVDACRNVALGNLYWR